MTQEAFIEVIKDHQRLIYKVCNMYCADSQKRKDLQQDILLQLWISMDRYDGRVKLSTWIYRVALNTSIAFYHSENKYQARRQILDSSILVYDDEGGESILDDKIRLLNRHIRELSVNDRAIVLLYLDKVKHKDIAEIMGISETNVATKIARVKEKLKQKIKNDI